jgi:hypothetical protein
MILEDEFLVKEFLFTEKDDRVAIHGREVAGSGEARNADEIQKNEI